MMFPDLHSLAEEIASKEDNTAYSGIKYVILAYAGMEFFISGGCGCLIIRMYTYMHTFPLLSLQHFEECNY